MDSNIQISLMDSNLQLSLMDSNLQLSLMDSPQSSADMSQCLHYKVICHIVGVRWYDQATNASIFTRTTQPGGGGGALTTIIRKLHLGTFGHISYMLSATRHPAIDILASTPSSSWHPRHHHHSVHFIIIMASTPSSSWHPPHHHHGVQPIIIMVSTPSSS